MISGYLGQFNPSVPANIANGAQVTGVIPTGGFKLSGIKMPAAFTSVTLTFTVCDTANGTFVPLNNASGPVTYTVAVSNYYAINPADFEGVAFFKINTNAAEGAARILTLSMKG